MNELFDAVQLRRGTNCVKWDTPADADVLPVGSDMDFRTASGYCRCRCPRGEQGFMLLRKVRGYYRAIVGGSSGATIGYRNLSGSSLRRVSCRLVSSRHQALTHTGDRVIIQPARLYCFYSSIRKTGAKRRSIRCNRSTGGSSRLRRPRSQSRRPRAAYCLLCNPHNPVGRLWTLRSAARGRYTVCATM